MTPKTENTLLPRLQVRTSAQLPTKTYCIDWDKGQIQGTVDGLHAMAQAIRKMLYTTARTHLIYPNSYGLQLQGVLGAQRRVAESELKRTLWEALQQDARITQLSDVEFVWSSKRTCTAKFTVQTIFGAVREEMKLHV